MVGELAGERAAAEDGAELRCEGVELFSLEVGGEAIDIDVGCSRIAPSVRAFGKSWREIRTAVGWA